MKKANNIGDTKFDSLNDRMKESIDSFIKLTGVPVAYYDKEARLKWESHNNKNMCSFCRAYEDDESFCKMNLKYSGNIASQLGDVYIFLCRARLTRIAFPVINNNEHIGSFIAGPIILGKLRSNVVEYVLRHSDNNKSRTQTLLQLNETGVYEPKMVSAVANIFGSCIYSCIHPQYDNIRSGFKKAQKLSDIIQDDKRESSDSKISYPMGTEKELMEAVTNGDVDESIELMHKYLESIALFNIGDIGLIKLDIIQMFGLLLRKIKDDMAVFEDAKEKYNVHLEKINNATNIAELSRIVADLVEQITVLFETGIYIGDEEIVKKTINYISKNYRNKISLKMIAEELHISGPYLSTLFKKEMGKTFSEFTAQFRIKKSESMLKETSMTITEIALLSGFEDQSYFNKVFKKTTGKTPKQFRNG